MLFFTLKSAKGSGHVIILPHVKIDFDIIKFIVLPTSTLSHAMYQWLIEIYYTNVPRFGALWRAQVPVAADMVTDIWAICFLEFSGACLFWHKQHARLTSGKDPSGLALCAPPASHAAHSTVHLHDLPPSGPLHRA